LIYVKSRLIFGLVGKAIKLVLKTVYKFLSFFNLHITAFLVVVGGILFFTGVLTSHRAILLLFYVLVIGSVIYSLYANVKKFLGLGKKVNKKQGVQIVERDTKEPEDQPVQSSSVQPAPAVNVQPTATVVNPNVPIRYFAVKDNPSVVVAEYDNRYVLYYKSPNGFKYIRTDLKG
jgi:Na+(H+)/acetate symporter ActP